MSYLALARKWRPGTFADVVGQEHVVRALGNAIETERVHHAYLFAGTRGVGKTTVARILAKALNCEEGVNAEPCGECGACVSIDEGRFVDLIEVDAASKTKVDDTRELLENVQYTPTAGRYKVYLIDEVHMLSNHSFNALLKTLEEPPPHVKFLLATTDPQKLPVTVLSRCLQFNLKRLPTALIVGRMAQICEAEDIAVEGASLARIARAASGSMRDALSLLDQALAFCGGGLSDADVADMLGSMDKKHINELLQSLAAGDAAALLGQFAMLQELVPDYESVLDDMATILQQVAVVQLAGADSLDDDADQEMLQSQAASLTPELVQLFYQIAITGRRDLAYAPDPRIGFEMTLLRMLAFERPGNEAPATPSGGATPARTAAKPQAAVREQQPATSRAGGGTVALDQLSQGAAGWNNVLGKLALKGAARQLAENCLPSGMQGSELQLQVSKNSEHLLTEQMQKRLVDALNDALSEKVRVKFSVAADKIDTIAAKAADETVEREDAARQAIQNDPNVQELVDMFGAEVEQSSIRSVDDEKNS